jgi:hypothetical protein
LPDCHPEEQQRRGILPTALVGRLATMIAGEIPRSGRDDRVSSISLDTE